MSEDIENRAARFQQQWWGYGAGALALWAFSAPLLRYASPENLNWVGYLVFLVIFLGYWSTIHKGDPEAKFMIAGVVICGLLLAYFASSEVNDAIMAARMNDSRCFAIQRDMLSAHRRMSDAPNVFQALGCRPQGEGIIFVPPTNRELRAKHALKDGGYPNR